jgi:hypothetical protein
MNRRGLLASAGILAILAVPLGSISATAGRRSPGLAPEHRIATCGNDGTLWAEQPHYFRFASTF